MKFILHKNNKSPSFYYRDGIIDKVDMSFLKLIGYTQDYISGMTAQELTLLLRLDGQADLSHVESSKRYYIFTKENNPKEVNISSKYLPDSGEQVYYFKEIEDSSLNDILANDFSYIGYNKNAFALYSLDGLILIKANDQYIKILQSLGASKDQIIGKPPIYKELLLNYSEKTKRNQQKEVAFMKEDNSVLYFDLATMPFHSEGKEKYLFNIVHDVTEKVSARKILKKKKEHMAVILENVSDKIMVLNKERKIVYANKSTQAEIKRLNNNFLIEDITDKIYLDVLDGFKIHTLEGDEIPFDLIPTERVLKGETFYNYMFLGTNEYSTRYNSVHGMPLLDDNGQTDGGILIYNDITNSIILEEYNLLKEKTRDLFLNYASLSYPDFMINYINDEGYRTLKEMNPDVKDMLSLIGKNFFELYKIDGEEVSEFNKNINELIEGGSSCSYKFIHKFEINGKLKYLKTIYQPVYNDYKKIDKVKVVGIDITKEKEDNEKLHMALKTQEDIFVNISHELKTPLHLIFSASQLLSQQVKKYSSEEEYNEIYYSNNIILQNCYRLTKLINNILDISKIESGFYELNLANKDIVSFTEDIIYSVAEYIKDKGLSIIFDTESEENVIAVDPDKFERIMLNLISNAIKFSDSDSTIYVNLYIRDDFIEICVKDEGIGIAEDELEKIFNKFHQVNKTLTRETEGSGIGLSLVKYLVELQDGEISVESELGAGSTFKIKFLNRVLSDKEGKTQPELSQDIGEVIKYELSDIY